MRVPLPSGAPASSANPVPVKVFSAPAGGFKQGEPISEANPAPVQLETPAVGVTPVVASAGAFQLGEPASASRPWPVFIVTGQDYEFGEPASAVNPLKVSGLKPDWAPTVDGFYLEFAPNDRDYINMATYNSLAALIASPYATFSRAASGLYTPNSGVVQSFASGLPRYGDRGLLVERASTNLLPFSTDPSVAAYHASRGIKTAGQADPMGGTSAILFTCDGTSDPMISNQITTGNISSRTFAFSVYLKLGSTPGGEAARVRMYMYGDIGVEAVSNLDITITGSWARYTFIRTYPAGLSSTQAVFRIDPFDGTGGTNIPSNGASIYTWGWQAEELPAETSLIVTGASSATRPADLLTLFPVAGTYTVTFTFDDASTQVLAGQVVTGAGWAVPTNLNRRYIKNISAVRTA